MRVGTIRRTALLLASACVLPVPAGASSFQILEQSPSRLGTAFAGTASTAEDATTVFFNPAGMAQLDGPQFTVGGNAIIVDSAFDDDGSTAGSGTGLERPLPGKESETDEPGFVPNFYYTQPLNERWTVGFGVNAPFGLTSEYDDDWQGRYQATESTLSVVNINPTLAYAINDRLSIGFGVSYQHAETTLENAVDSFNACREAGGGTGTCAAAHGGPGNPDADNSVEIEGDDDAFVADLSVHWQPSERTTIGVTWRQGAEFDLDGDADFSQSTSCSQDPFCNGALTALDGDIEAEAELPDTITVSGSHQLNQRWTVHGDIAWTEWSSLQSIPIENTENGENVSTLELEYDNTVRLALGAAYSPQGPWTWRAGLAHDESPQEDEEFVSPRIPDADRTWIGGGFNYAWSNDLSVDVGYAHLFVDDVTIDRVEQGNRLKGKFEASVDLLAAQANWRF